MSRLEISQPTQTRRNYKRFFALDPSKLNRIFAVGESCMQHKGPYASKFIVVLKDGRSIDVTNLDAVLALDNTVQNPISVLEIYLSGDDASIEIRLIHLPAISDM